MNLKQFIKEHDTKYLIEKASLTLDSLKQSHSISESIVTVCTLLLLFVTLLWAKESKRSKKALLAPKNGYGGQKEARQWRWGGAVTPSKTRENLRFN
jgi:hypothetical protein